MWRSSFVAVACLTLLAAGGCGPTPMVQVETTIRPDGSCERSIWQPRDRMLPVEAFTREWIARWRKVEDAVVPPAFARDDPNPGEPYFHAQGVFDSPADIPDHFRKIIEEHPDFPTGKMVHTYERRDFGVFVEHRWSETLANGVTREEFAKARDEFIELGMPILLEGVRRVYEPDYDVSAAVAELDRRGRPLFRDLADAWFDALAAAAGNREASAEVFTRKFVAAIERAGVDLRDSAGELVDNTEGDRRARAFLAARIAATFRRSDGSPPTPEDVRAIMAGGGTRSFETAWHRYDEERSPEIEAKLLPLLARMTGPYFYPGFLASRLRFAFDVRLPGRIVTAETNGEAGDDGAVSWRFDADRLFPTRFTMTAASVEIDRDAQRLLLGRAAVRDVAQALAVRDLLADDPELTETLRKACETGDASLLSETPATDAARLAGLRRLLGMAP